jgi:ATP-dependent exoDNAse (exonuclease V) alpha subunit
METLKVTITKIIFSNDGTGFKVLNTRTLAGKNLIVTGEFGPEIIPESIVSFHGDFKSHPKYGHQFKAYNYTMEHNAQELASIRLFLDNVAASIGPERSEAIIAYFGMETLSVIEHQPDRLTEVPGIGKVLAAAVKNAWQENREKWAEERVVYSLRAFLGSLGLRERKIKKILAFFGGRESNAENYIKKNPYCLVELDGFGFTTVDFIARKLGIPEDSQDRLKAFVLYLLDVVCPSNGHLFLTNLEIVEQIKKYCDENNTKFLDREITDFEVFQTVRELVSENKIIFDHDKYVYSKRQYDFERNSATLLTSIMEEKSDLIFLTKEKISGYIEVFEHEHGMVLSEEQKEALYYFAEKKVFVITGLPGTGKTTVLKAVVTLAHSLGLTLTCMTPTGIAAKKLSGVIQYDAYTIHRRLGFKGGLWTYNELNQYHTDVVIIDESCLPYKQFVDLPDGTRKYIGEIVNQKLKIKVLSYNLKTKKVEPKEVIGWFKYPRRTKLYEIKLSKAKNRERQRILRCTGKHKIHTSSGKIPASELKKGDLVLIRGNFLNYFQKSFLLGSILGDAYISNKKSGRNIKFVHGQSQEKYIKFKSKLFNCRGITTVRGGYKPRKLLLTCNTVIFDDLDEIYDYTYPKGKRTITKKWLNQINEIGLAAWYMDDGGLSRQKNKKNGHFSYCALLHTEGFSKKENNKIKIWLRDWWDLTSTLCKNGRGHYYIRLDCKSSIVFWKIIAPWTISSMAYKFPKASDTNTEFLTGFLKKYPQAFKPKFKFFKNLNNNILVQPYPIQEIKRFFPKGNQRKNVYDICVKDNHNYFSNNVLVSNSMVDQEVFFRLLSALRKRTHIILVGDHNQLPSVGAGNVLRELISSGQVPTVRLEKIFRQEEASDIIKASHRIIHGNTNLELFKNDPKADIYFMRIREIPEIERIVVALADKFKAERREFQIITARNTGPLGIESLNNILQVALNPPTPHLNEIKVGNFIIRVGDRVIVKKNDYENDIFNGDIGKVISIAGGKVLIKTDDKLVELSVDEVVEKIKLAYGITVHKSQGLEYKTIILLFINQFGRNMLQRNLLYTALTRAKKKVIVIGHGSAIERAIENTSVIRRNTLLGERIKTCLNQKKNPSLSTLPLEPEIFPIVLQEQEPLLLEDENSSVTDIIEK